MCAYCGDGHRERGQAKNCPHGGLGHAAQWDTCHLHITSRDGTSSIRGVHSSCPDSGRDREPREPPSDFVPQTLVDPEQANMSAGQGFGADTLVQDVENQPTQPGFAGQQGPCGGATGVLALMDFKEYEVLYDRWQRGELNHKEVASYYGAEVLDLMLAQEALSHEASPAVECVSSTRPGPEEEVLGMRRGEDGVWIRYGFAHFEVVYGQWKLRERTDEEISQSYGPEWVRLFRVWRTWSLQAIWHLLPRVLDVSPDTATARSGVDFHMLRPEPLPEVIRLPFFVVKDYYEEWVTGAMSDSRVVEKFGAVWLVWFRRLRDEGVDKVRDELSHHVFWEPEGRN